MEKEFTKRTIISPNMPSTFIRLNNSNDYLQLCNLRKEEDNKWVADSRIIDKNEYDRILSMTNPDMGTMMNDQTDSMEAITDMYADIESLKSDQLDTMEAIADIYAILEGGA